MSERIVNPTAVFPLTVLGPALRSFQPPSGEFDPAGSWTHRYGVWTVGQRGCARVGRLDLGRTAREDGTALLMLEYMKDYSGRFQGRTVASIHTRTDALATPLSWGVRYQSHGVDEKTVPGTAVEAKAEVRDGRLLVRDGAGERNQPLPPAWTVNWALFDAVQRLPRGDLEPLHFTLFDDFDEQKPHQRLAHWRSVTVELGGRRVRKHSWRELDKGRIRTTRWAKEGARAVRLHGYVQTGPGVVPVVYWSDDTGRLLFVAAGIEAYIYEPVEGQAK
jgi:hypothetical protein